MSAGRCGCGRGACPAWQTLIWVIGWLIFVYAMCGAPGVWPDHVLLAHDRVRDHRDAGAAVPRAGGAHHAGAAGSAGRPDKTMGPREFVLALVHSRYLQVVANPVVAAVIFFFSLATFFHAALHLRARHAPGAC